MFAETITEARAEKAMIFLAQTDEPYAKAKTDVARTEYAAKLAEHRSYLVAEGSIPERKATAELSGDAQTAWAKHYDAIQAYELLRAQRERNVLVIELFRGLLSARKQGMQI